MKRIILMTSLCLSLFGQTNICAQQTESMYGDVVKADVKMNYVFSMDEAIRKAKKENKLIFFNCFADWAIPCHSMNKAVFSDAEFCKNMDKNFVNLFIDVTSEDGKEWAEKYKIESFAQYLILDTNGNIVLRIVGGKRLPDFYNAVIKSLNSKTSLVGTEKIYNSGKYSKKDLLNYFEALHLANDKEHFPEIGKKYMSMISPKEYSKKENWTVFTSNIDGWQGDLFKYLLDHKKDFLKNIGHDKVDGFIEKTLYSDVFYMATGAIPYDADKMKELYYVINNSELPDSSSVFTAYKLAKLRGERKYDKMIDVLRKEGSCFGQFKTSIDLSLDLPGISEDQKRIVVEYLKERAKEEEGEGKRRIENLARTLGNYEGIVFEKGTLQEALNKSVSTNKLFFIDCYTSWCGPCKMMANNVFPLPQIGNYFNEHFVNYKQDMEKKEEGVDFAKKYKIKAYPTMLLLDTKGDVVLRIVGSRTPQELLQLVMDANDPVYGFSIAKEAYLKGDRSAAVVRNYAHAMKESGMMDEQQMNKIIGDYIDNLSNTQFCSKDAWYILDKEINKVDDSRFNRLLEQHNGLVKVNGEEKVNRKIEKVVFPYIISYFEKEISSKDALSVLNKINLKDYPKDYTLNVLSELVALVEKGSVENVLSFYNKRVKLLSDDKDRLNIDLLLYNIVENSNKQIQQEALDYATKALESANVRAQHSYTKLVEVLKQLVDGNE